MLTKEMPWNTNRSTRQCHVTKVPNIVITRMVGPFQDELNTSKNNDNKLKAAYDRIKRGINSWNK